MKIGILWFTVFTFLLPELALAAKPINNLVDVAIPTRADGTRLSLVEVRDGVFAGCRFKGWAPTLVAENKFEASIHVRSHFAKVAIEFDEFTYSISYMDSDNLDYDPKGQKIHRNYNKWVVLLSQAIQNELMASM